MHCEFRKEYELMFLLPFASFFLLFFKVTFMYVVLGPFSFIQTNTSQQYCKYVPSQFKNPRDQNTGTGHPEADVFHKKHVSGNKRKRYLTSIQWLYKV